MNATEIAPGVTYKWDAHEPYIEVELAILLPWLGMPHTRQTGELIADVIRRTLEWISQEQRVVVLQNELEEERDGAES